MHDPQHPAPSLRPSAHPVPATGHPSHASPGHPAGHPAIHGPAHLAPPGGPGKITAPPVMPLSHHKEDLEPIALEDEPMTGASKIRAFGIREVMADTESSRGSGLTGAAHIKSFHGRLSDEGLQLVDNKINEWLEKHPEIEVKFATTTVGMFDGKIKDVALIVNVWY